MKRAQTIALGFLLAVSVHAQNFPVRITPTLAPPYTPFLKDLTVPGSDKLTVQVLLNDLSVTEYRCRLRLTIEGVNSSITTNPNYVAPPLVLQGGVPELLLGSDLADYFRYENLQFQGISPASLQRNGGQLPEGIYRFTFEVIDYNRGTVVSNRGTTTAWMVLNDPPLINQPFNNAKLKPLDPQNIVFQWTPRHRGSPNAAFSTEYNVKLVEIWPRGRNPYDAMQVLPPIFEATTEQTMVVYGPSETPLVPGREYALQVQARDVLSRDLFRNQGYSEVVKFTYGDECPRPTGIMADDIGTMRARLRWQGHPLNSGYRLRYREQAEGAQWFEENSSQTYVTAMQMKPGVTYQYEVCGVCDFYESDFTPTETFTTLTENPNAFSCGDAGTVPAPDGSPPLPALFINDFIKAGGYDVVVTKATGSNGVFTGEGLAVVPWFHSAKVRVTFQNIGVNQSYQLTRGEIKSVWDPNSRFIMESEKTLSEGGGQGIESVISRFEADSLIQVTGVILSVALNTDGDIVVQTNEGELVVSREEGKTFALTDEGGNGYVVQKDPTTGETTVTKVAGGGLNPGSNTTPTASNATPKEKKLIAEIVKRFENQIVSVLNPVQREPVFPRGAGPMADDFYEPVAPSCMPEDQDQLKIIKEYLSKISNDEKKLDAFINAVYQNENDKQTIVSIAGKTSLADNQKFEDVLSIEDLQKVESSLCSHAVEEAKNYVAELWWRAPYWERAAKILKEHLEDTGLYEDVTVVCSGNECKTIGVIKLSEEVTTTVEVTFSSQISDADTWAILTQHGVDFWEGRSVTLESFKDRFWNYMAMKDDHLYQGKGWESSVLRGFADVLMAPYGAVNGWVTGKHWRTGETLAGWEQALAVLDVVPGEAWAKLGVTAIIVKVGSKVINLARIKTATRNLLVAVIGRTSRLSLKAGDEFILVAKQGDELAIIGDDVLTIKSAGWIDDVGEAVQLDQAIKLVSSEGDVISKVKLIQLADGSVGFVEIVDQFSSAVNTAVKGRGSLRKALGLTNPAKRAHHLIPVKVLKDSDVIQKAVDVGFDFNGKINGFAIDEALHGSHIAYNDFVLKRLNEWRELNKGFSGLKAKKFLEEEFVPFLIEICEEAQKTGTSLQDIVKQL